MAGKNGRKFMLFLIVFAALIFGFVLSMIAAKQAMTEGVIIAWIGAVVLLYIVYVVGNVLTKLTIGKVSAEFDQKTPPGK